MRTRNENRGEYPWNWRRISYRVKRLHGFRCERCSHPHVPRLDDHHIRDLWLRDWATETRVYRAVVVADSACDDQCRHIGDCKQRTLTVHHLDGDKANCRLWNLAALCQQCHLQIQAKVCWDQTYFGEHIEWMLWHIQQYRRWCERTGRKAIH